MYWHIASAIHQMGSLSPYPLLQLPDWAVHYIMRYLEEERLEDDPYGDVTDALIHHANIEWGFRKKARNKKRVLKTRLQFNER